MVAVVRGHHERGAPVAVAVGQVHLLLLARASHVVAEHPERLVQVARRADHDRGVSIVVAKAWGLAAGADGPAHGVQLLLAQSFEVLIALRHAVYSTQPSGPCERRCDEVVRRRARQSLLAAVFWLFWLFLAMASLFARVLVVFDVTFVWAPVRNEPVGNHSSRDRRRGKPGLILLRHSATRERTLATMALCMSTSAFVAKAVRPAVRASAEEKVSAAMNSPRIESARPMATSLASDRPFFPSLPSLRSIETTPPSTHRRRPPIPSAAFLRAQARYQRARRRGSQRVHRARRPRLQRQRGDPPATARPRSRAMRTRVRW